MFSKVIRRTHMYLALFLAPWMLMYALSTLAMNHRASLRELYGGEIAVWEKEGEQVYEKTVSEEAETWETAYEILVHLGFEGPYSTRTSRDGTNLTIFRNDPITPRRITYTKADGKLLIEKQNFQMPSFLERMHRRRGYQYGYAQEDAWAFSVDLVIFSMVFWSLSGLWMWWELKGTRRWGAISSLAGVGLFLLFLFTI